jgi:hypothetical protein
MAPAKSRQNRGAMAKDPKTPATSKRGNWKHKGQWVDKEGYRVDNYGKRLANQAKPFVAAKDNPFAPKTSTPTTQGPAASPTPTPQENIQSGMQGLVQEGIDYSKDFDPNTYQQKYEPQFEQGMQRAYDTIYNQFERKNQEQFARQNEQLQQSLVERGLDPNSPAYQALTRQLAEQQTSARQDAQNAAWQQAQGYQQQGYTQATGSALLPAQIASPYLELYGQGQQLQFTGSQADKQRQFEARQAELNRQNQLAISKRQGGGGQDPNAAANALAAYQMSLYGNQGQNRGQSTANAAVTGAAQAFGAGITGRLTGGS